MSLAVSHNVILVSQIKRERKTTKFSYFVRLMSLFLTRMSRTASRKARQVITRASRRPQDGVFCSINVCAIVQDWHNELARSCRATLKRTVYIIWQYFLNINYSYMCVNLINIMYTLLKIRYIYVSILSMYFIKYLF